MKHILLLKFRFLAKLPLKDLNRSKVSSEKAKSRLEDQKQQFFVQLSSNCGIHRIINFDIIYVV